MEVLLLEACLPSDKTTAAPGAAHSLILLFARSRKSFRNPKLVTKAEEKDTHPSYKRFLFIIQ